MPSAVSIQDWANSGVRKLDDDGGASALRAVRDEVEVWCGLMGANALLFVAKAMRMARLADDAFMIVYDRNLL